MMNNYFMAKCFVLATMVSVIVSLATASVNNAHGVAAADRSSFEVPAQQRQLFLGDHGVADMYRLRRTMHRPVKQGAVIRPDQLVNFRNFLSFVNLHIRSTQLGDDRVHTMTFRCYLQESFLGLRPDGILSLLLDLF